MKRALVLGVLVAVGGVSLTVRAFPQATSGQAAPMVVVVEKLKDNLFILKGADSGGNTAVFVQSDGVTVVDTKNPGWGQPILAKIKELTSKPVTMIINTHTHGDHVSGNVEFPATVDVVTHANTKANMEQMLPATGMPPPRQVFKENNGRGMPTRTFTDRMTLGSGPDQIDLRYFGRGHTNGDAWVIFPALRVAHAGDIFSGKNLPLLDANNGGSGVAIPDTLAKAASGMPDVDAIITGHSTVMTLNDLTEYAEFNRDFLNAVRDAKKAGRTIDEVASSWTIPAKYNGYTAPQTEQQKARLRANVEIVFKELP